MSRKKRSIFSKVMGSFVHPVNAIKFLSRKGYLKWMSDERYLKLCYRLQLKQKLNLQNPVLFNEKIQWLKLYGVQPEYSIYVDKYEVKNFISKEITADIVIPTIGVWDNAEQVDINSLPRQFVLKTTHDSGGIVICKDKSTLNVLQAKEKLGKCLKNNGYWYGREKPYYKVSPRIIAEQYKEDYSGSLLDYKVFVFSGEPYCIQVDFDRFTNHQRNFYSTSWEYLPFSTGYPTNPEHEIPRPGCLDEILSYAKEIAIKIGCPPFVRVDFYDVDNHPFFGEITFYHGSGFEAFTSEDWNKQLGDLIVLPQKGKKE